jgi:cAMP-dependent protein kinase regulator
LIISGEAIATKTLQPGSAPEQVMCYKPRDYFGEIALLKNEPRAANIIAKTALTVASIDRESFKRLLGPLDDILKRNMASYSHYVSQ